MCKPAALAFSFNKPFSKMQADYREKVGLSPWAASLEALVKLLTHIGKSTINWSCDSWKRFPLHFVLFALFSEDDSVTFPNEWLRCGSKGKLLLSRVGETHFLLLTRYTHAAVTELLSRSGQATAAFQQNSCVAEAILETEWQRESVVSVLVDICKLQK